MSKKLLYKTSQVYLIYSVIILVIAAPLFYFTTHKLYLKEADDTLLLHKNEFVQDVIPSLKIIEVPIWNRLNRNIKLETGNSIKKDSLYFISYYDTLDAETEPYRELHSSIKIEGENYTYKARTNLVETEDLVKNIGFLFIGITIILLLGLYIITQQLSKKLWQPFYKTLLEIESFQIDKATITNFKESKIEEFNRLNSSLTQLINTNKRIYNQQKEFVENAAHELQTPLAVFQAKIDILMQRTDVTEEQLNLLSTLDENVARLNRLNKNLLLLSKIENEIYQKRITVNINDCIKKNFEFFKEQADAKNIKIEFEEAAQINIITNAVLAEVLLSNLFLNAIRHNIIDGFIKVICNHNKIKFINTGFETALNKDKLFNRFSKIDPSQQGSGLGLSIIKKIANKNNWQVEYSFENNLHEFTVQFNI